MVVAVGVVKKVILTAEVREVKYLMSGYYAWEVISSQVFDQLLEKKFRAGYLISGVGGVCRETRIKAPKRTFWKKGVSTYKRSGSGSSSGLRVFISCGSQVLAQIHRPSQGSS